MAMTRIRVDFNSRGVNGTVRAHTHRANGPVAAGSLVIAFDPDETDMEFPAVVSEFDPDSGRLLLEVMWHVQRGISARTEPTSVIFSKTGLTPAKQQAPGVATTASREPVFS